MAARAVSKSAEHKQKPSLQGWVRLTFCLRSAV